VLYARQLASLRPATLIEIGTSEGGSAVWLRDQLNSLGLADTKILTIDIAPPNLTADGIAFYQGDAHDPEATFPHDVIALAPHPWLVIEDSAHSYAAVQAVLGYFDRRLVAGDAIVIEDGVLADLDGAVYRQLDDGPNRAVAEFLQQAGTAYSIDEELADFYGPNVTWAPNGWLRRHI
jgi:cephalosporin hydroxylase